jgi:hypothetical protein
VHAQLKDWGNRFEGTVFRPHAAGDYELLRFYIDERFVRIATCCMYLFRTVAASRFRVSDK